MNDKIQIENYLDQKVNPLLEELLTQIIKNRPKNVVNRHSFSSNTAAAGFRKKQIASTCFPNSQTPIPKKRTHSMSSGCLKRKMQPNGIVNAKVFVDKFLGVIINGMISKLQPHYASLLLTIVSFFDSNRCFSSKISMTAISIV